MRLLRPALLVVALAACAWFVVGIRQAHEVDFASDVAAAPHPDAHALAGAHSALSRAGFLNPDQEVNILRAEIDFKSGHQQTARRLLSSVIRAEPRNLDGWIWYTGVYLGQPEARVGARQIADLDPIDAKHLTP